MTEDVQFSMPPLSAWFEGREAVAQFTEDAIFSAARQHGVTLRAGSCNGQPAFATYEPDKAAEPDGATHLVVTGLQIVQLNDVNGELLISALVSYRDPAVAVRCGLPAVIDQSGNRPARRSR